MKTVTAMLVDDEISSLQVLQQKVLKFFPQLNVLAAVQVPEEAIKLINETPPDILFLDVKMPRIDGFELLAALREMNFQVIFITAFGEYALKAFKQSAVGYVLKPIDDKDLQIAVNKALKVIELKTQHDYHVRLIEILTETLKRNNKLIVPTAKGLSFVPQAEVLHLEGYEGYTKINLVNGLQLLSSYNLGRFEKCLGKEFFKCHKSHIVNLEKVRSFENEGYVMLENGKRVPISVLYRKAFLGLFK